MEDSFSSRNIEKTAEDFSKLENITLSLGENDGIIGFLGFTLVDYLVLVAILVIAYQFLSERKNGLWDIVHLSKRGRSILAIKRTVILFAFSAFLCIAMYGENLVAAFILYGGEHDLARPVQSISEFEKCDIAMSIQAFLLQYISIKIASVFLVGVMVWCMLSAIQNLSIGMIIMAGVLTVEYTFFYLLPVQSIFNLIKYVNIFSYIDLHKIYVNYLNVNIFGQAVGARDMILTLLPVLLIVFVIISIVVNARKKPKESSVALRKILNALQYIENGIISRLNVCMLEVYKCCFYIREFSYSFYCSICS